MADVPDKRKTGITIRGLSAAANRYLQDITSSDDGPSDVKAPNTTSADASDVPPGEARATAQLYSIAAALDASGQNPRYLATVLAVGEAQPHQHSNVNGERVKVVRSQLHPQLIGLLGYAMPESDDVSKKFVVFNDGQHGVFTELSDTNAMPEILEGVCPAPPNVRTAFITQDGRNLEITIPENVTVQSGDTIRLTANGNFAGVAKWGEAHGDLATVEEVLSASSCIVRVMGSLKTVSVAPSAQPVSMGQRVVLHSSGTLVLRNLGMQESSFHFAEKPTETWDMVIGQDAAVAALKRALRPPRPSNPMKRKPRKGAILIGPPGCGKSHLARAAAHETDTLYFYIKATELFRSLVGEAEALLRHIIRRGEVYFQETGKRPIYFIDEIDGIAKTRGTNLSSDAAETILLTLMKEMDDAHGFFLAATNRIDTIDPALIRPGRLTLKLFIGRPNKEAAEQLFALYLNGVPTDGPSVAQLAHSATEELFSDHYPLYTLDVVHPDNASETLQFGLRDVLSGALVNDGIVEQAKELAEDAAETAGTDPVMTLAFLNAAITLVYHGEQLVNYQQAIAEYAETHFPEAGVNATRLYQKRS